MATTVCTVCGCKILEGPVRSCPRCETPHHEDCWTYNGGCAVYACNPATKAVLVAKPRPTSPAPWIMVLIALGGFVCAAMARLQPHAFPTSEIAPPPHTAELHPAANTAPWVGYTAPDFSIRDLDGKVESLSAIRRGRVMILSFWLAHCRDCMPHVPAWAEIYNRYKENDDLVLVNVAAYANDPAPIRDFCELYHIGGRVLMDGVNQAVPAYQLGTITTLVIDSDGVIRFRENQAGASADRVAPVVESLLARRKHSSH